MKELIIAKREFKSMVAEKSFALVVLFEILLVSSSTFLAVGYTVLTTPESSDLFRGARNVVYAGIITQSKTEFSRPLQQSGIAYFQYEDLLEAEEDFQSGVLDTIIIGSVSLDSQPDTLTVYLPSNTPKTGLIRLALKRFFLNIEERLRKVKTSIYAPDQRIVGASQQPEGTSSTNFEVFLIFTIPFLFFMPSIMAGSLIIDTLTEDMESSRIINLLSCPLSASTILSGKCVGAFLSTIVHCLLWIIILSFSAHPPQSPLSMIIIFTLYTIFFILSGAIISLLIVKNRASQMAYTLMSVASIMLFSPAANAADILIKISPAYVYTNLAMGSTIADIWWQTLIMLAANLIAIKILCRQSFRIRPA
jgi:ABC-2 type transport system permease protein